MKFIVIIILSIFIFSCQNNNKDLKDESSDLNSLAESYYNQKFGCDRAYFNESKTYGFDLKLKSKNITLYLCQCDSLLKNVTKTDNFTDTIISSAKLFFQQIKDKHFKYYSIEIYNDFYKHEFNKAINLKYDSLKNDFYFYNNELIPI